MSGYRRRTACCYLPVPVGERVRLRRGLARLAGDLERVGGSFRAWGTCPGERPELRRCSRSVNSATNTSFAAGGRSAGQAGASVGAACGVRALQCGGRKSRPHQPRSKPGRFFSRAGRARRPLAAWREPGQRTGTSFRRHTWPESAASVYKPSHHRQGRTGRLRCNPWLFLPPLIC